MSDVSNSVAELQADQALVCDAIAFWKGDHSLSLMVKALEDFSAAASAASGVLPELADLDEAEVKELSGACYQFAKAVLAALKA